MVHKTGIKNKDLFFGPETKALGQISNKYSPNIKRKLTHEGRVTELFEVKMTVFVKGVWWI